MVKPLLLWIGLFLWAVLILCWGIVSMFSPSTMERFMEWYARASRWSTPKPPTPTPRQLSQRVAGFLATLMGGWMVVTLISRLLRFHTVTTVSSKASPSQTTAHDWSSLIVGIVVTGIGVYNIMRPEVAVRMTQANFPNRDLSEDMVKRARRGGQILGVLFILFGAYLLFLRYK